MTAAGSPPASPAGDSDSSLFLRRNVPLLILMAIVLALASYSTGLRQRPGPSAEGSADAGFARDMAVHHAQAVQMAEAIRFRTADPAIRTLASDIALSQQAQIGQMAGWLESWGLPATGRQPPMAWMGHRTTASMPGMATRAEVTAISQVPLGEAEIPFLQAMIRHHQGGVVMAEGLLPRSRRREVRRLAEKIIAAQQSEIQAMSDLLNARGVAPPPAVGTSPGKGESEPPTHR